MTTVFLLSFIAVCLRRRNTDIGLLALLVDLLADEGRHGVLVPSETWLGTVGGTGAVEIQSGDVAVVVLELATAKSTAGVLLTKAPLRSHGGVDGVGVNGGVGSGTGALRSDEAGEHRNGDS